MELTIKMSRIGEQQNGKTGQGDEDQHLQLGRPTAAEAKGLGDTSCPRLPCLPAPFPYKTRESVFHSPHFHQ